jgi:hypothetical protein
MQVALRSYLVLGWCAAKGRAAGPTAFVRLQVTQNLTSCAPCDMGAEWDGWISLRESTCGLDLGKRLYVCFAVQDGPRKLVVR